MASNQIIIKAKELNGIHKVDFELKPVVLPEKPGVGFGLKETTDVIDMGLNFGMKFSDAYADGKINLMEAIGLGTVLISDLPAAYSGIDMVPAELKDVKKADVAKLVKHVIEKTKCSEESAQLLIQKAIDFVYSGYDLFREIKTATAKPEAGTLEKKTQE